MFDLGKQRLKSGQSQAAMANRFAAKNLWIQLIGRYARMAWELPEIEGAAKSSTWWGVREDGCDFISAGPLGHLVAFWNFAQGRFVLRNVANTNLVRTS